MNNLRHTLYPVQRLDDRRGNLLAQIREIDFFFDSPQLFLPLRIQRRESFGIRRQKPVEILVSARAAVR